MSIAVGLSAVAFVIASIAQLRSSPGKFIPLLTVVQTVSFVLGAVASQYM